MAAPADTLRSLNVQRLADARGPQMQSLHSLVSDRLSDRFHLPRSLRRRTTSHKRRRNALSAHDRDDGQKNRKKPCRRERRRRELRSNHELGFVMAPDGSRRLRTHLWHAKRFRMVKAWGFCLPLGAHGGGRGSRAVLRCLQKGALLHDASYYLPLQLEGAQATSLSLSLSLSPLFSSKQLFCS